MSDFLYRLVARLHDRTRPLSRNRHFHVFTGSGRQALRIERHLRDLEGHLAALRERGEQPRVRLLPGGGAQLVLSDARLLVVRTAVLSVEEVALLRQHPAGAWALGAAGELEATGTSAVGPAAARGKGWST